MASKAEMLALLNTVVDKIENVQATVQDAVNAVEEAIRAAAEAFGVGMEAGSDAEVAESLLALKEQLETASNLAARSLSASQESANRHA